MTSRHATFVVGGCLPSIKLCKNPVRTRPHVTANPFAIDPNRFVISPTSTPPIAPENAGIIAPRVYPSKIAFAPLAPPRKYSPPNTMGPPVSAIASVNVAGITSPPCNAI